MSFPVDIVLVDGIQYIVDQTQMHPLGTRGVSSIDGDCRVWHYTKLATTTRTGGYGAYAGGMGLFSNAIAVSATIVTATDGESVISATVSGMTANEYQGGLFTMFEAGFPIVIMGIKSNLATGVTDDITLDGKLPATYSSSATAWVVPGPYHEVIIVGLANSASAVYDPCVGVFNSPEDKDGTAAAAGDYCWIQTWGPCNMWCSATFEGDLTGQREVVMCGNGCANINVDVADTTRLGYQRIGFLYNCSGPAADNVAEHIANTGGVVATTMNHLVFLQIAP